MPVRVPDPWGTKAFVGMLVVFLVGMLVRMLDGGVLVFMIMAFRQVQPDAHGHQHPGSRQPDRDRLSRRHRDQRSEKRCN